PLPKQIRATRTSPPLPKQIRATRTSPPRAGSSLPPYLHRMEERELFDVNEVVRVEECAAELGERADGSVGFVRLPRADARERSSEEIVGQPAFLCRGRPAKNSSECRVDLFRTRRMGVGQKFGGGFGSLHCFLRVEQRERLGRGGAASALGAAEVVVRRVEHFEKGKAQVPPGQDVNASAIVIGGVRACGP